MITAGKRSLAPLVAALGLEPTPVATDWELLGRFLSRQDEVAFEALVRRHGPMVLAVCRRALGCTADAEDAFQATLLVLLQKAPGLASRTTLGDWLHGVARRIALKARTAAARRRAREGAAARPEGNPEVGRNDWLPWLDEEVGRLPAKYRLPLVLCDLEGQTRGEAAGALGWPEGTVAGYLARGRAMLARRLLRRASALGGAVAGGEALAVPARLLAAALPSALGSATPVVLALARGVTRSMTTITNTLAVSVLALVTGGLLAAGTLMSGTQEERGVNTPAAPEPGPPPVEKPEPQSWKETKVLTLPGWLCGSVAYSPDGKTLYIGGTSGRVQAYDTETWKQHWDHQELTDFAAVAAAPDGKSVAVTFKDADRRWGVRVRSAATAKLEFTLDEGGVPGVVRGPQPYSVGIFPDTTIFPEGGDKAAVTFHKLIFGTADQYVVKTWADPEKASTITSRPVAAGKMPADSYAVPLAIDPDGKRVVVTGPMDKDTGKNVLWAWSAGSGEANKLLEGHKATVICAAWSKNGKVIVTGDDSGLVIVWDATTFKEKSRLKRGGRVAAVAVTHDGLGIAAAVIGGGPGTRTGDVFAWLASAPPEKPEPLSSQQTGSPFVGVASLAFSPDGKQLAAGFANLTLLTRTGILIGHVRVFAAEPPPKVEPVTWVNQVVYSPDGKRYAVVPGGVFDAAGKKLYDVPATAFGFSADGKTLFAMSDKAVLECDAETGKVLKQHPRPKEKWGWHLIRFSPDGKRYAAHHGSGVMLYDTATGFEPLRLDEQHEAGGAGWVAGVIGKDLVWSPDGKHVAAVGIFLAVGKPGAAVWEVETRKRVFVSESKIEDGPVSAAFTPDGDRLAVGRKDSVEVWVIRGDAKKNPERKYRTGGPATAIAYSKDGKLVAVGVRMPILNGADRAPAVVGHKSVVQVFDATTAEELKRFDGFEGVNHMATTKLAVTALAFTPDGKRVIAGTGFSAVTPDGADLPRAGEVKVFSLDGTPVGAAPQDWRDTAILTDHGRLVNGVAVSPDGKSFAAATDGNVTCWNATTREVLWKTAIDGAFALAFSRDGKTVFVAGKTEVARVNAGTGVVATLYGDATGVAVENSRRAITDIHARALAVSPDGKRLAGTDGYATWMVEPDNLGDYGTYGGPTPKDAKPGAAGVAWSADGKRLATIHPKHTERTFPSGLRPDTHWPVRLWSVAADESARGLFGHDAPVTAVAWSKDGKAIASGGQDGLVILWDAESGKELWRHAFKGRDDTIGRVNSLAISPADNTVAVAVSLGSGKAPERVVLLAPKDGEVVGQVMRWSIPVASVAWSPDGTFFVTGCGAAGQSIKQTEPAVGEVVVWERKPR